jgi:hypothetical protein
MSLPINASSHQIFARFANLFFAAAAAKKSIPSFVAWSDLERVLKAFLQPAKRASA